MRKPTQDPEGRAESILNPIDVDALTEQVRHSKPFPHVCIDNFLERSFAADCAAAFPTFEDATRVGRQFSTVNEQRKVQITDTTLFPEPVARLHEVLNSPSWLGTVSTLLGIPNLISDPELRGGGLHVTGASGHLDVHVDFNYLPEDLLHRRSNILLYLTPEWEESWGGKIELWDPDVKTCHHSFAPVFNRCVIFETNDVSFHGVSALTCPSGKARQSYAAYYYTKEAPAYWTGKSSSTIFRARPNEKVKGWLLMPLEKWKRTLLRGLRRVKHKITG